VYTGGHPEHQGEQGFADKVRERFSARPRAFQRKVRERFSADYKKTASVSAQLVLKAKPFPANKLTYPQG